MEQSYSILILILAFIFGSIVGSFLNVIVYRLGTGRGIGGRSACMNCSETLSARDLVPIFSYVALGGKCRHCKSRIDRQYPLVEFITGLVFAILTYHFLSEAISYKLSATSLSLVFFSVLIAISVYDIRHKIIPPILSNILFILALVSLCPTFSAVNAGLGYKILGALVLAGPIFLLWAVSAGRWIGFGDIRLALPLGLYLGAATSLTALIFSFWLGALSAIPVLISHPSRNTMKREVPFGPFLAAGAFIALLVSGTGMDLGMYVFP